MVVTVATGYDLGYIWKAQAPVEVEALLADYEAGRRVGELARSMASIGVRSRRI